MGRSAPANSSPCWRSAAAPRKRSRAWPRPRVRAAAARAYGWLGDEPFGPLVPLLGDPAAEVRRAAAAALAERRWPSLDRSHRRKERGLPGPLLLALGDPDPGVRAAAVGGLRAEDGEAVAEALAGALGDPDPRVRARACMVARHPRGVPGLIGALDHPWRWTRMNAAAALGEIGAPEAVEPLIARLGARDRTMRAAAASALGRIRDPRAVAPLRALLARSTDPQVRSAATHALAALERPPRTRRWLPRRRRSPY